MQTPALVPGLKRAVSHVAPPTSPRGRVLGDWRVVERVGCGGTAEVWHAVGPDGDVALKLLKPELRSRPGAAEILRRELALLCALRNPYLVTPVGIVDCGGTPGLVLEYLPGGDLVPLLGTPCEQWLPALRGVTAALSALHRDGTAHGDIKARNVLFAAHGGARLIDLTTARPVTSPAALSTAAYRVPSPAAAGEADAFALAALVYELGAGRLPYGTAGATVLGASPAAVAVSDDKVKPLLAAATAVLRAGGRPPYGLSRLADVIESVGST
jgi:serine/threonine protein kinase